jgi:hypothetical protein
MGILFLFYFFCLFLDVYAKKTMFSSAMASIQCTCTGFCRTFSTFSVWAIKRRLDCTQEKRLDYEHIDLHIGDTISIICPWFIQFIQYYECKLQTQRFRILSFSFKMRWLRQSSLRYCMFTN